MNVQGAGKGSKVQKVSCAPTPRGLPPSQFTLYTDWGMASTSKGKRERLQEPEAGAKRAKTARAENEGVMGVSPQISPTALSGNRVAWKDAVNRDWLTDVKAVVIGEGTPGGGQKYSLSVEDIQNIRISAFSSHEFVLDNTELGTMACSFNKYKAQLIAQHVGKLAPSGNCLGITQHVRPHSAAVSDSDDEQIVDEEIPPGFTNTELAVVEVCYKRLQSNFVTAVTHRFTNAAGKMFFWSLGEFILQLYCPAAVPYASYISTNPHGDCQPGSMILLHTCPAAKTRQCQPDDTATVAQERVSDYVMYNHETKVYIIAGEIKSKTSAAENQNIEQMVGLWRKKQCAMLGFTCNNSFIQLRVLVRREEGLLLLYRLPRLSLEPDSLKSSLLQLAYLFIAFTSFVTNIV